MCKLHTKSQKQKRRIDKKDAQLKQLLQENRDEIYQATGYRYRGGDIKKSVAKIKSCQNQENIPIAVRKAIYELERVENEFLDVFPARYKNADYLPGTIRGRFLVLDGKDGGIEPGLLMVPILRPDGTLNKDLAHDLIKFFNAQAAQKFLNNPLPFNNEDDVQSIDDMLTLIDRFREAGLCFNYMKALQKDKEGVYRQTLYLLKQDYDETHRMGDRINAGERIKQTHTYAEMEKSRRKNNSSRNKLKQIKNIVPIIKASAWENLGKPTISSHNKDALFEVIGTQLVGVLMPGQTQRISLIKGVYADGTRKYMTLCEWKPRLETLTDHVEGTDKYEKILALGGISDMRFYDAGGHLITMLMTGDYDGVGSRAQNIGAVQDKYGNYPLYKFDVGHAFGDDENVMIDTLERDFTFQIKESKLISPKHFKNYTIFNDFRDDEKMEGVFKLYKSLDQVSRNKYFTLQEQLLIEDAIADYCKTDEKGWYDIHLFSSLDEAKQQGFSTMPPGGPDDRRYALVKNQNSDKVTLICKGVNGKWQSKNIDEKDVPASIKDHGWDNPAAVTINWRDKEAELITSNGGQAISMFAEQYNSIKSGDCQMLFDEYRKYYPKFKEDIDKMEERFYNRAEKVFDVFKDRMMCLRSSVNLLFNIQRATCDTVSENNDIKLKHLKVVQKNKLIWDLTTNDDGTFTLSAKVKDEKQFNQVKNRLLDYANGNSKRDILHLKEKLQYDKNSGKIVMQADELTLDALCEMFNEKDVKKYKEENYLNLNMTAPSQQNNRNSVSSNSSITNQSVSTNNIISRTSLSTSDLTNHDITSHAINDDHTSQSSNNDGLCRYSIYSDNSHINDDHFNDDYTTDSEETPKPQWQ